MPTEPTVSRKIFNIYSRASQAYNNSKINSVKFTDGTYEVTLPVKLGRYSYGKFSESHVAFFVDKTDGGELPFFYNR